MLARSLGKILLITIGVLQLVNDFGFQPLKRLCTESRDFKKICQSEFF